MRSFLCRFIPALCFVAALAASRPALAEPPNEPDDGVNSAAIASLRQERAGLSRGLPITLIVVGGVVGVVSLELAQLQGLSGMGEGSASNTSTSPCTGCYVASAVGFAGAVGGILWLVDVNRERGELDERIARLRRTALVVPALDPTTKTAALSVLGHF